MFNFLDKIDRLFKMIEELEKEVWNIDRRLGELEKEKPDYIYPELNMSGSFFRGYEGPNRRKNKVDRRKNINKSGEV